MLDFINLSRLSITVGVPGINRTDLSNEKVPVPPLPEQARIVTILREADELRRLRQQARTKLDNLLAAIFYEMFGDPINNTRDWPTRKLSSLCTIQGGGTPSKARSDYWGGSIPWVSPKDMTGSYISETEDHITEEAVQESATNLIPEGAVLVVTRSGILKHTLPLALAKTELAINQDLKAFIPKPGSNLDELFLLAQLQSRESELLQRVRVGATVHNIATNVFSKLELILPDKSLQEEFVDRVITLGDIQSEQLENGEKLEELFKSLMAKAFSGELTAVWRDQHQEELREAAVQRDIALGLRGEEPSLIDFEQGRVTPAEEEQFRQQINQMMKPVAQEMAERIRVSQTALTAFSSQYQSALTKMVAAIQPALPRYENLVNSALAESVASLNKVTQSILASAYDAAAAAQPIVESAQRSQALYQSLGQKILALADEQMRQVAQQPPPQPERAIHPHLNSAIHAILQASQAHSTYFTPTEMLWLLESYGHHFSSGEDSDLVQVETALELLETAGFVRQVVVEERLMYRLAAPIEDGALLPEELT